jgi:hypothetical protein
LQEPWKKNVERLEMAEYFYKVRFDSLSAGDNASAQLQKEEYNHIHHLPSVLEIRDPREMIVGDVVNLQRRLEVISLLTIQADDKSLDSDRRRLSVDLNSCVKESGGLLDPATDWSDLWSDENMKENVLKLIVCISNVERGIEVLEPKATAGVVQEKEHFALLARKAGWWSVGCYSFGWALGLLGKLAGDGEVVEVTE